MEHDSPTFLQARALRIASGSGNDLVFFLDQICLPSTVTSNRPPSEGINVNSSMAFPFSVNSLAARPTALSV